MNSPQFNEVAALREHLLFEARQHKNLTLEEIETFVGGFILRRQRKVRRAFLVLSAWYLLDITIAEAELFAGVLQ